MPKRIGLYYCTESSRYKLKLPPQVIDDEKDFLCTFHHSKLSIAKEFVRCINEGSANGDQSSF